MKNGRIIRYIRPFERESGYTDRAIGPKSFGNFRIGYLQDGSGGGKVRSGIVLENTAPYADYVRRRHYHVISNATRRSITNHQAQLVKVATAKILKEAGLIR